MTKVVYRKDVKVSCPTECPVLVVGQLKHLQKLKFKDLKQKFGKVVTEETYKAALTYLDPSPVDTVSLYLEIATLAALGKVTSRHNTTSRCHQITKVVQSKSIGGVNESVLIVCEYDNVYASGLAVARAFPLYSRKTKPASEATIYVEFLVISEDGSIHGLSDDDVKCLEESAYGVRLCAKIVDAPCNEMNVCGFLKEIEEVGKQLGIKPLVIRGEELKEKGFGGIYGVGKAQTGSLPALAVLSHFPNGAEKTIALVGKGIVYDTGGLSIKSKTGMPGMKRDCGGAAGILGGFYAAVKGGFNQNLHAVFCLAENSVGPIATRPDDIHTLYSGKTVEINNTDAEGRLVLSDGVVYADRDLKAKIILDMATLTGAQAIATGKYHGAILTNDEDWETKAIRAGKKSGDLLFPVPYAPELHFSEFASAIADMKNSVADRNNAQVSCAGLFINAHLGFDYDGVWMHCDMATPVHCGERATGYGVALLCTLFADNLNYNLLKPTPSAQEPPLKKMCK